MNYKGLFVIQSPIGIYTLLLLTMTGEAEQAVWYAMRATYQRGQEAGRQLEEERVEHFIPMRYTMVTRRGRKNKELVPVIRNLIFVHTTPTRIKEVKLKIPFLQYMTEWKDGRRVPILVPTPQMLQFIAVVGTYDEQLVYLEPTEINLAKGTKVRIRGGLFDGQEGTYLKLKGHRDKRVVVAVPGVIAVAIATLHPSMIEPIAPL